MSYFHHLFPDEAKKETVVIDTSDYTALSCRACALFESYCGNLECECRDIFIDVEQQKSMTSMKLNFFSEPLAVLRYSLEKPISKRNPSLSTHIQQSSYAKVALVLVREYMESHPEYVIQLQRHYDMMKEAGKNLHATAGDNVPVRREAEPGRNEPCSCGSGEKYKKCCLLKQ
jgi:hypothetical protein